MHFKSGDKTQKVICCTFSLTNQICFTLYLLPKLIESKLRQALNAVFMLF